jgi:hypothetical protein
MPVVRVGEIDARIVQASDESIEGLLVDSIVGDESAQLTAHTVAIARHVESFARGRDDAGFRR